MKAVVEEVQEQTRAGRAVLVGTRNIDRSMQLSALMDELKIDHEVLNANQLQREAEIIKLSGRVGAVTVATNMAGRGTDFLLEDSVRDAGGLHVILTEIHEAARIDWQLIGRGARQGMPGSYRTFVSMEDELLAMGLGPETAVKLAGRYRGNEKQLQRGAFQWFLKAQRRLEKKHLVDRMILLKQDQQPHEQHFEMGQDPYCDVVQS
jgi:preprotein translocase subunit SecA